MPDRFVYNPFTGKLDDAGSGTVSTVSITTANGISGSVATPTTTPAITLTLGDITPTSVTVSGKSTIANTGLVTKYNNIVTTGWGIPAIYASGRSIAQTAAVASVSTYTCGAADGSFLISANANITTFVAGTFNVTVAYTDETNTARTLTLNFSNITGTLGISLAAAGPFEGIPAHIRVKASTAITIATIGTFTSLTYNVEGYITQIG